MLAGLRQRATASSECSGSGSVEFAHDAVEVTLVDLTGDVLQVGSGQLPVLTGDSPTLPDGECSNGCAIPLHVGLDRVVSLAV